MVGGISMDTGPIARGVNANTATDVDLNWISPTGKMTCNVLGSGADGLSELFTSNNAMSRTF